jgi:hypothetical protein
MMTKVLIPFLFLLVCYDNSKNVNIICALTETDSDLNKRLPDKNRTDYFLVDGSNDITNIYLSIDEYVEQHADSSSHKSTYYTMLFYRQTKELNMQSVHEFPGLEWKAFTNDDLLASYYWYNGNLFHVDKNTK